MKRIVIDPGHSGSPTDLGACGNGLQESNVTFAISKLLKDILLDKKHVKRDYEVLLTREMEVQPATESLEYRANFANGQKADLFISLHCNYAAANPNARGFEVWVSPGAQEAQKIATYMMDKLEKIKSKDDIDRALFQEWYFRGIKEERSAVLQYTSMPAILIELAFLSNVKDAQILSNYQWKIAYHIAMAIEDYYDDTIGLPSPTPVHPSAQMLSKYFSLDELSCRCCNQLPSEGMSPATLRVLDAMREKLGRPLSANCGYRCPSHNAEVGGVSNSDHIKGNAVDIDATGIGVDTLAEVAIECGAEGVGRYYASAGNFVHIDMRDGGNSPAGYYQW